MQYWEENIPWSFTDLPEDKRPSFEERRKMRYALQDYMHSMIGFDRFKGKSVLEVGCGAGIDAVEFARNGAEVYAIDTSPLAIEETKRAFKESGFLAKKIWKADIRDISMQSFDCIYSFGVLHHVQKVEEFIEAIRRRLKISGEFIGMFYNRDSILWSYSEAHGLPIERNHGSYSVKAYSRVELAKLLSRYFRHGEVRTVYNVIDLPGYRKVKLNIPDNLGLGWHHIVRCSN